MFEYHTANAVYANYLTCNTFDQILTPLFLFCFLLRTSCKYHGNKLNEVCMTNPTL